MNEPPPSRDLTGTEPDLRALGPAWLGLLAPPLAWVVDLGARYMLTRTVNRAGEGAPLHLVTLSCLVVVVGAGLQNFRTWRSLRSAPVGTDEPEVTAAARTFAIWGLGLAAFFALLILAQAFPSFVLGPRDLT